MDYLLERSKRRTVSILVRDGRVLVRAPYATPVSFIEEFVASKADWIAAKLSEDRSVRRFLADVLQGNAILYGGRQLDIRFTDSGRIAVRDEALLVPEKYRCDVFPAVTRWLKQEARVQLADRLAVLSDRLRLAYRSFSVSNAKTRWGSCSSAGDIRLNVRLVMLDGRLSDYVIVHELCHLLEMNHSARFWRRVEAVLPDYKARRKELKKYSVLLKGKF